jgi:hypothetical protein
LEGQRRHFRIQPGRLSPAKPRLFFLAPAGQHKRQFSCLFWGGSFYDLFFLGVFGVEKKAKTQGSSPEIPKTGPPLAKGELPAQYSGRPRGAKRHGVDIFTDMPPPLSTPASPFLLFLFHPPATLLGDGSSPLSPHSTKRHNSLWRWPCGPRSEATPTLPKRHRLYFYR